MQFNYLNLLTFEMPQTNSKTTNNSVIALFYITLDYYIYVKRLKCISLPNDMKATHCKLLTPIPYLNLN